MHLPPMTNPILWMKWEQGGENTCMTSQSWAIERNCTWTQVSFRQVTRPLFHFNRESLAIRNCCQCPGGFCHLLFFSLKGKIVNIAGFAGSTVSVATALLCPCSGKAAVGDTETNGWGFVPVTFYLQKQAADCIGRQAVICYRRFLPLCC